MISSLDLILPFGDLYCHISVFANICLPYCSVQSPPPIEVNMHCIYADSTYVGEYLFLYVCEQSYCRMTLGIGRKLRRSLLILVIILALYTVYKWRFGTEADRVGKGTLSRNAIME